MTNQKIEKDIYIWNGHIKIHHKEINEKLKSLWIIALLPIFSDKNKAKEFCWDNYWDATIEL